MRRKIINIGLAGLGLVSVLATASIGYEQALERDKVYDYLDQALLAPDEVRQIVDWGPPSSELVRPFTPVDERKIGKAMSEAWSAFAVAQDTGETGILADYFTGVALDRAQSAASVAHDTGTGLVTLEITGQPEFYHLDGSVFQARARSLAIRFAEATDGLNLFQATRDETITTFMNESSGWRVFSHERTGIDPVNTSPRKVTIKPLVGMNYYPAKTPWRAFWSGFDPDIIAKDFDAIRALGANAVRVFLPRETFLAANAQADLGNLVRLLRMAEERNIYVVPTLFDLKSDYALAGWYEDAVYLTQVMPVLSQSDAVAYVDLKNEPDLDFEGHGRARVEAWVRAMAVLARELSPELALTVGWSTADHALVAADALDVVTYHEYQPLPGTTERLEQVRTGAGTKPVMVTEIGQTAWSALAGWPGSPARQAKELAARITALNASDGIFVWTLHDFPNPDPLAVGRKPWVQKSQGAFGLFDANGNAKPAAKSVSDGFTNFLKGKAHDQ